MELVRQPGEDGPRLHCLVVDDEAAIRRLLRLVLQGGGFDVREAASVPEALHLLLDDTWQPDVVLLELVLRSNLGTDLLRLMRLTPGLDTLPVAVVTGRVADEDRLAALHAGADAFIPKPFGAVALLEIVQRLALEGRRPATDRRARRSA